MRERLRVGSLFTGIGGFDWGLEQTGGFRTVWFCEQDQFCQQVIASHWPGIPCYPDIRELRGADVEPVDVLCGGFPCQDLSLAGKGAGLDGERSGLWSEYARLVRELQPRYVLVENVSALLRRGFGRVLGDLAACGFDAEWDCIPASRVGAPHQRDRVWLVAYPNSNRLWVKPERDQRGERCEPSAVGGNPVAVHDGPKEPVANTPRDLSAGAAAPRAERERTGQGGEPAGETGCWLCGWAEEHYAERGSGLDEWIAEFRARHVCDRFSDADSWRRKGIRLEDVARIEREAGAVADGCGGAPADVADPGSDESGSGLRSSGAPGKRRGQSDHGGDARGDEDVADAAGARRARGSEQVEPREGRRQVAGGRGEAAANTEREGLEGLGADTGQPEVAEPWDGGAPNGWGSDGWVPTADWWAVEPDVGRVAHGVPLRVDRLRSLGNALVPQIAFWLGARILEWEEGAVDASAA